MNTEVKVGYNGVMGIKVSMEGGQMAEVPWAVVMYLNGSCTKHNLVLVSGVELALRGGL